MTALFWVPDGTVEAADGNRDLVLQVSCPIIHRSSLTKSRFRLTSPTGFGGGTSPATFSANYAAVNEIEFHPGITKGAENFSFDAGK